jgi:hypothetical protein
MGDGEVIATFRQPFDVLLKTNAVAARRKAANTADPSKNEIWLAMRHRTRSATASDVFR